MKSMSPAEVAQPELVDDLLHRLEVDLDGRFLEGGSAHVLSRVDVDDGERLGLLDHDVAAALQPHLLVESPRKLDLEAVMLEDRLLPRVELDPIPQSGKELRGEVPGGERIPP